MKKELYIAPQVEQIEIETEGCIANSTLEVNGCSFENGDVTDDSWN